MSNTILKTLSFSNMFSYGENNVLQLDNNPITQLSAINGSGKSSTAIILQELLYNKNVKGIKKTDILNRYTNVKAWEASITFSANNKDYVVTVRRQGATTKVTLLENSIDISEHKVLDTYKKISEILGMTFEVFSQLTYQSSIDSLEFLKATDANRKKFLINLFNLEKYIKIGDKLKVKATVIDKELLVLQGELKSIEDFLDKTTIEEYKNEVEIELVDSALAIRISELQKELDNVNETCKKIDRNNLYIKDKDLITFEMNMEVPEEFKFTEEYEALVLDIKLLNNELSSLQQYINNTTIIDNCHSCGQSIDNEHIKKIKAEKEKQIVEKRNLKEGYLKKFTAWKLEIVDISIKTKAYLDNIEKIKQFEQLTQIIDLSIAVDYPNVKELETEKQQLVLEYSLQDNKLRKSIEHNKQVSSHNAKVEALIEQKNEFINRQIAIKDSILSKSSQATNLNILKKAFSTSGIVAFKLENLTKELEISINHYLSLLSDGQFQVEFILDREKLNITVISDGVKAPIETTSGGEFSRIQTAILFAIRSILSKLGGSSVNLLFLDEVMSVLDDAGKEGLIEILLNEPSLNVFLISHEYTNPLIPQIEITKQDNISTIQ